MSRIAVPRVGEYREYVTPRYVSWPLANLVLYVIVLLNYQNVTVEPGQGGEVAEFMWPTYWMTQPIVDAGFSVPEYTVPALLWNYVLGVVPVYIVLTLAINVLFPQKFRDWPPSHSVFAWGGILLVYVVTYIPLHLFGLPGVVLWFVSAATTLVTALWRPASAYLQSKI